MDLYKVVRSPIDNAVTSPGPDHRSSPSFAEPIRHDLVKNTQITELAPIFHKPIQIAGSIFINWQIISHFRQVHGVVGL